MRVILAISVTESQPKDIVMACRQSSKEALISSMVRSEFRAKLAARLANAVGVTGHFILSTDAKRDETAYIAILRRGDTS
jgi:hypothetical protein